MKTFSVVLVSLILLLNENLCAQGPTLMVPVWGRPVVILNWQTGTYTTAIQTRAHPGLFWRSRGWRRMYFQFERKPNGALNYRQQRPALRGDEKVL